MTYASYSQIWVPYAFESGDAHQVVGFWLKHQRRISRVQDTTLITVPTFRAWRNHMTFEVGHTITSTQPAINDKDWPTTLDSLSGYLTANLGEQGKPLYYAIHPHVEVPPEAGNPSTGYVPVDLEMIARGPHIGYAYQMENRYVWEIMHNICYAHMCYIYIKGAIASLIITLGQIPSITRRLPPNPR
jgi:hypothetical protein